MKNYMKPNIQETKIIFLTHKTDKIKFNYYVSNVYVLRRDFLIKCYIVNCIYIVMFIMCIHRHQEHFGLFVILLTIFLVGNVLYVFLIRSNLE